MGNCSFAKRMGKVKGKAKSGPKGGAKRHISKVKRSNQRQNKLVKQGKARPNSKPKYVANQRKGEKQGGKGERDIKEEQVQWAKKKEEDHEEALQQLADSVSGKDAAFLNSVMAGKKRKADDDDQAWKFCIFWEPGSEPKKSPGAKKKGREKGRKGDKRKE